MTISYDYFTSQIGLIYLSADEIGLRNVEFIENIYDENEIFKKEKTKEILFSNSEILKNAIEQLRKYFEKSLTEFSVPVNLDGTDFQKSVWNELTLVPFGETRSYLKQAIALKNEKAIRAVAKANGSNPIAIIIPCHRIIGSDGSLTGYAGELWRKKWLLEHEGFLKAEQLELF